MNVGPQSTSGGNGAPEKLISHKAILCLLLAAMTLAVYWPVRQFDFLGYDDPGYYSENIHVQGGFTWRNIVWSFTSGDAANWHPLTWLSHMLDAEFFGNNPSGPHLVNLLFHAANVVLLFLLLDRLTAARWRSGLVALLFAVHPLHVESVAWIAERKDLLCAFFMLLTFLFYGQFASLAPDQKARAWKFYCVSLACFVLSLLSKPMAVTLPFLLLLLDWWPLNRVQGVRSIGQLLLEKVPFFFLSIAVSVVTFVVQKHGQTVQSLTVFSMPVRIENAFVSYARYVGKIIWPATLAIPYPHPGHWPSGTVRFSVLLFVSLSGAALWLARSRPQMFTGWFWFVGMLVPVIGLVQVGDQSMADRYAYLPMIGLLIIFAWGLADLVARWKISPNAAAVAAFFLFAALTFRTREQLPYWKNDSTLFSHAIEVTQNNFIAHVNLGAWLSKNGQGKESLDQYNEALQLKPDDPTALYDVGNAYLRLGLFDEAIADYRQAHEIAPKRPDILDNLGLALSALKQIPEAMTNYEAALKIQPDFADAHNNLGTALFKLGKFQEAAEQYYAASKIQPDNPVFYSNLGDAMAHAGNTAAAVECYQQALQLEPGNAKLIAKLKSLGAP